MKTLHFFDMDGVLARFDDEKNAVQRFQREAHFFLGLKPYENTLKEVQALINKGENVYILTASPHKGADMDKREWIRRYLPSLPSSHFIAVRLGAVKVDAVKPLKKARYILYDDYSKNRLEWCARGRHFLAVETRGQ